MAGLEVSLGWYVLAVLQTLGLASTWLVRRREGCRHCQRLFMALLAAVGSGIIASLLVGGTWLPAGMTFSIMAVAGTCEFRSPHSTAAAPLANL